eukprot:Hpha_TRINITY_DN3236_c0_g1::TRINITY_DN3236_c0_g1_i2::g.186044::m.186044
MDLLTYKPKVATMRVNGWGKRRRNTIETNGWRSSHFFRFGAAGVVLRCFPSSFLPSPFLACRCSICFSFMSAFASSEAIAIEAASALFLISSAAASSCCSISITLSRSSSTSTLRLSSFCRPILDSVILRCESSALCTSLVRSPSQRLRVARCPSSSCSVSCFPAASSVADFSWSTVRSLSIPSNCRNCASRSAWCARLEISCFSMSLLPARICACLSSKSPLVLCMELIFAANRDPRLSFHCPAFLLRMHSTSLFVTSVFNSVRFSFRASGNKSGAGGTPICLQRRICNAVFFFTISMRACTPAVPPVCSEISAASKKRRRGWMATAANNASAPLDWMGLPPMLSMRSPVHCRHGRQTRTLSGPIPHDCIDKVRSSESRTFSASR